MLLFIPYTVFLLKTQDVTLVLHRKLLIERRRRRRRRGDTQVWFAGPARQLLKLSHHVLNERLVAHYCHGVLEEHTAPTET